MEGMTTGSSAGTDMSAMSGATTQRAWGRQAGADMQECIQNCLDCHATCTETATYCLQMGGKHADASHRKCQNWRNTVFSLRLCPSPPNLSLGYHLPLPGHQQQRLQGTESLPE